MNSEWWRASPNVPGPLKYWIDLSKGLLTSKTDDIHTLHMANLRLLLTELLDIPEYRRREWITNIVKQEVADLQNSQFLRSYCHADYLYMLTQLSRALDKAKFGEIKDSANRLLRRMEKDNFFSQQLDTLKEMILETNDLDDEKEKVILEVTTSLLSELLSRGYTREYLTRRILESLVACPSVDADEIGSYVKVAISDTLDGLTEEKGSTFEVQFGLEGLIAEERLAPLTIIVGGKSISIAFTAEPEIGGATNEEEKKDEERPAGWQNIAIAKVDALDKFGAIVYAGQGLDVVCDWLISRKLYVEGGAEPPGIAIEPIRVINESDPYSTERLERGIDTAILPSAFLDKASHERIDSWFRPSNLVADLPLLRLSREKLGRTFHWTRIARSSRAVTSRYVSQWFAVEHLMQPLNSLEADTVGLFETFCSGMAAMLSITLLRRECAYLAIQTLRALKEMGWPQYAQIGESEEDIEPLRFVQIIRDKGKLDGILGALEGDYVYLRSQIKRFADSISTDTNLFKRISSYHTEIERSLSRMWRARCRIAHGGYEFKGEWYFCVGEYLRILNIYSKLAVGTLFRYFENDQPPLSIDTYISESRLKYNEIVERLTTKAEAHPIKVEDILGADIL